jgi:hypothetical protein
MRLDAGLLVRCGVLGSRASYRIVTVHEELVEVEVVSAPGLCSGTRLMITREQAERMRAESGDDPPPPFRRFVRRSSVLPDPDVIDA